MGSHGWDSKRTVSFDVNLEKVTWLHGRFGVMEGQGTGRWPDSTCHLEVRSEASRGGDVRRRAGLG